MARRLLRLRPPDLPAWSIMSRLLYRATFGLMIGASGTLCACSSQSAEPRASAGASSSTVGCSPHDDEMYVPGSKRPGAAGHFDFALVSSTPAPPALGDNLFVVQVSEADGPVASGDLSVTLDMPQHGHQSPKQPEIRFDAESQAFVLEPMRLFMVGLWQITFGFEGLLDGAPSSDSAVFEICID
jgi:hypothetical protein